MEGGDQPSRREPDARFTLANERTFLAWNRTALALMGGGLAAAQLLDFDSRGVRLAIALPLIVLGGLLAGLGYTRWRRADAALRAGEPLPASRLPAILAAAVGALAVLLALLTALALAK